MFNYYYYSLTESSQSNKRGKKNSKSNILFSPLTEYGLESHPIKVTDLIMWKNIGSELHCVIDK